MNIHKGHKILGMYCWECQRYTAPRIPGWPRPQRGPFVIRQAWASNEKGGFCEGVVWADGKESKRGAVCSHCFQYCTHPVDDSCMSPTDSYGEIGENDVIEC
jgi:hypothetical protein